MPKIEIVRTHSKGVHAHLAEKKLLIPEIYFRKTNCQRMNNPASIVSPREYEVLRLIAFEYSTQEIADALYVSFDTALTHRKNLLKKLQVKNAAGLVRVAFERGFLSLHSQQAIK